MREIELCINLWEKLNSVSIYEKKINSVSIYERNLTPYQSMGEI